MTDAAFRVFVIAEAGVNHNGDPALALKMVDAAAEAGADAVKFQTFRTDDLVTADAGTAAYQAAATGGETSQAAMLRSLELSPEAHKRLQTRCTQQGIKFLSTPFELASLALLAEGLGLDTLKISSGDLTNGPLLLAAARTGCRLILSTGMATMAEVAEGLGVVAFGLLHPTRRPAARSELATALANPAARKRLAATVTLLQCTSAYPTPYDEVNLKVMDSLRERFGLPVGLSDHTPEIIVAVAAAARGAKVIEKHFTMNRAMSGPDHAASVEPDQLAEMVRLIRIVERALGTVDKAPSPAEADTARVARKSVVAARDIAAGEILDETAMTIKRPGTGLSPMTYWELVGTAARRAYRRDEPIVS